jgi:RecG-like helicase
MDEVTDRVAVAVRNATQHSQPFTHIGYSSNRVERFASNRRVRLADGTGFLTLRFFHFSGAQQEQLVRGAQLACFGEVRRGKHGPEIVHPEYRNADAPDTQAVEAHADLPGHRRRATGLAAT